MERFHKGESLISLLNDYTVIDLETTGLNPSQDKIIEIGAIKVRNDKIVDRFEALVNPGIEISNFIQKLTGISNQMITDCPDINSVLPQFKSFIGNDILLGHNVTFDINFLYDNYLECFGKPLRNDFIDLLRISRREHKDLPNHKLGTLAGYFNFDYSKAHRATVDCEITNSIYREYKNIVIEKYGSVNNFIENTKGNYCIRKKVDLFNLTPDSESAIDPCHPFFDKRFVFTGALTISRAEAAQLVVNKGGHCEKGVTKNTNFLIIGNFDYINNIKGNKSSKMIKAEELILNGQDLSILTEDTFFQYMKTEEKIYMDNREYINKLFNLIKNSDNFDERIIAITETNNIKNNYIDLEFNNRKIIRFPIDSIENGGIPLIEIHKDVYKTISDFKVIPKIKSQLWSILPFNPDVEKLISDNITDIYDWYYLNILPSDTIGCCQLYEECSNAKTCIHSDKLFRTRCVYKRNLEQNMIFYGKNRNI